MSGQQRCLTCAHAVRDENPTAEQVILGQVGAMCLGAPPTAALVQQAQGVVVVAIYPMVNAHTYSCGMWTPLAGGLNG